MTVELLQALSVAAYIAAGVLLLTAIALFFLLDVPKLYGDISGKTAKKAIEAIRRQNESSDNKGCKPSAVNSERGKLTDKITSSGRVESRASGDSIGVGTERLSIASQTVESNKTTVLRDSINETTVLVANQPQDSGATTLLVKEEAKAVPKITDESFTLDVELSYIGSSEIIE